MITTRTTLGELLESTNPTIYRHAQGILKESKRATDKDLKEIATLEKELGQEQEWRSQ